MRVKVSARSRAVYWTARVVAKPLLSVWPMHPRATWPVFAAERVLDRLRSPKRATVTPVEFDGFTGEWTHALGVGDEGVVLYFHGGAFMFCGPATHRRSVAMISWAAGVPALSVAYRQLPVTTIDGSVLDAVAAYRWVLDQGYPADKVVLAGDSAGGYLSFAATLRAMQLGLPRPAGLVAISPLFDLDCTAKTRHRNRRRDAYIPGRRLIRFAELCVGSVGPHDPLLSPVNHDLSALPPALIVAAESEVLVADAEVMAQRLTAHGVPCTLRLWPGQVHAFTALADLLPESRAAIREIGAFVRERFAEPSTFTDDERASA